MKLSWAVRDPVAGRRQTPKVSIFRCKKNLCLKNRSWRATPRNGPATRGIGAVDHGVYLCKLVRRKSPGNSCPGEVKEVKPSAQPFLQNDINVTQHMPDHSRPRQPQSDLHINPLVMTAGLPGHLRLQRRRHPRCRRLNPRILRKKMLFMSLLERLKG